jgi:hypothetical protein
MRFTLEQLEKLKSQGKIRDYEDLKKPKASKYKNKKVELDGITFDSIKESKRYLELRARKIAGEIKYLEVHFPFELKIGDGKICTYEADFVYEENGKMIVEDVKSSYTRRLAVYRLKKKLMKELRGIEIQEV